MTVCGFNSVSCDFQRTYGERVPYLITVGISYIFFAQQWKGRPQTRAVMDDFGNLVIVENWL